MGGKRELSYEEAQKRAGQIRQELIGKGVKTEIVNELCFNDVSYKLWKGLQEFDENVVVKSAEEEYFGGEKSDRQEQLLQAMQKLKKSEKELLLRKYFYLQPVSKIARELGCTERSVEGKLARIRKKLKKMMDD